MATILTKYTPEANLEASITFLKIPDDLVSFTSCSTTSPIELSNSILTLLSSGNVIIDSCSWIKRIWIILFKVKIFPKRVNIICSSSRGWCKFKNSSACRA